MNFVEDIASLEALYGTAGGASILKVTPALTPAYRHWIERSRFCVLSTTGPAGTDGSPRGDIDPVVKIQDDKTLLLPDWRGNQRLDTLRNIVEDGRISLMFMVAGSTTVMRVNGTARLTADDDICGQFEQKTRNPKTVIVITISEVYPQCARAVMRAGLWETGDMSEGLPSVGDMLKEITEGGFDGAAYDAEWPERAKKSMW
ncbi:MAG: pyridoxamine 5'-phosphate oxidase family protein [Halocynthiibacter sp.]